MKQHWEALICKKIQVNRSTLGNFYDMNLEERETIRHELRISNGTVSLPIHPMARYLLLRLGHFLFLHNDCPDCGFLFGRHSLHAALQCFHDVNYLTTLWRPRCVDYDFFFFALFVQHAEHADMVLVFVVLRVELFRCEALDEPDAEL